MYATSLVQQVYLIFLTAVVNLVYLRLSRLLVYLVHVLNHVLVHGSSPNMKMSKRHILWIDINFNFFKDPDEKVFQPVISYITETKIRPLIRDVIFSFAENAKVLRASA